MRGITAYVVFYEWLHLFRRFKMEGRRFFRKASIAVFCAIIVFAVSGVCSVGAYLLVFYWLACGVLSALDIATDENWLLGGFMKVTCSLVSFFIGPLALYSLEWWNQD